MCYGALVEIGVESDPELIMGDVLRATLACAGLRRMENGRGRDLEYMFLTPLLQSWRVISPWVVRITFVENVVNDATKWRYSVLTKARCVRRARIGRA